MRFGEQDIGVEAGEFGAKFLVAPCEIGLHARLSFGSHSKAGQLASADMQTQCPKLGGQTVVLACGFGLAFKWTKLAANLAKEIAEPYEIRLGRFEPTLRTLTALAVLEDTGGFLDDAASILGPRIKNRRELTLRNDDVLLTSDAGIREHLLDVEETAGHAVDLVFTLAGAKQCASDRDLAEPDRKQPTRVVDREAHLGAAERGLLRRAREDDVFHLGRAETARRLCTEDPGNRIDDVRLSRPVRTNHNGDPRLEIQRRRFRERLEPLQGQRLQEHRRADGWTNMISRRAFHSPTCGHSWGRPRQPVDSPVDNPRRRCVGARTSVI